MGHQRTVQPLLFRALRHTYPPCGPDCAPDPELLEGPPLPVEAWLSLLEHLAIRHHPDLSRSEALQAIGRACLEGQLQGPAGPFLAAMLELGPERYLARSTALASRVLSFGRWEVRLLGRGHARLHCEDNPVPPDYYLGLGARALERCGTPVHAVEVVTGFETFTFDFHYRRG